MANFQQFGLVDAEKVSLVISRHWNNPTITVAVNQDQIQLFADIGSFAKGVLAELPHPAKVWTRAQMESALLTALVKAVEKVKDASSQVM